MNNKQLKRLNVTERQRYAALLHGLTTSGATRLTVPQLLIDGIRWEQRLKDRWGVRGHIPTHQGVSGAGILADELVRARTCANALANLKIEGPRIIDAMITEVLQVPASFDTGVLSRRIVRVLFRTITEMSPQSDEEPTDD